MIRLRERACEAKGNMAWRHLSSSESTWSSRNARNSVSVLLEFTFPEPAGIMDLFFTSTEETIDEAIEHRKPSDKGVTALVLFGKSSELSTIQQAIFAKLLPCFIVHNSVNLGNTAALIAAAVARQPFCGTLQQRRTMGYSLDPFHH